MERKHILFVIPSMEIGGTRSSLISLLSNLKQENSLDIDLFIINPEGDLMSQIPNYVNILPQISLISYSLPSKRYRTFYQKLYHLFIAFLNRIFGYENISKVLFSLFASKIKNPKKKYDAVIGYQEGIANMYSSYFHAKKYFTWIHSDINKWYNPKHFEKNAYFNSSKIFFVADNTKKLFTSFCPEFVEKCYVIKNTLDKDKILIKSKEKIEDDYFRDNYFKILSVGRLSKAKAFDRIIEVSKRLKDEHHIFHWYIIGDGELKSYLEELINKYDLGDTIKMLGIRSNPYPYYINADLVAITSLYESQPMVILEALTLSKPVLSTGFTSASEVLGSDKYGLICDNSKDGLYNSLSLILSDNDLYGKLEKSACLYEYNNEEIIEKFVKLIK